MVFPGHRKNLRLKGLELGLLVRGQLASNFLLDQLEAAVGGLLPEEIQADSRLYFSGSTASLRDLRAVGARDRTLINVLVVASEIAVHVIEHHSRRSAVCSYNRLLRFDTAEADGDMFVALSCYMGATPVAERLRSTDAYMPAELGNYVLRMPPSVDRDRVLDAIGQAVDRHQISEASHNIKRLI